MRNIEIKDNCVIANFDGFMTFDKFMAIAEQILENLEKQNLTKGLANLENMEVMEKKSQDWIKTYFFPQAKRIGLKKLAFVKPKNMFGLMSMEYANKSANEEIEINIQYFDELEKAKLWLLED